MSVLPIAQIGAPVLRQRARELTADELASDEIQAFIDDLVETMHHANGAGLAAIQVSRPIRVVAIEVHDNPRYPYKPNIPLTILVNPVLTPLSPERFDNYEGCLSVPNLRGVLDSSARPDLFRRFTTPTPSNFQQREVMMGLLPPDLTRRSLLDRPKHQLAQGAHPYLWRHRLLGDERIECSGIGLDGAPLVVELPRLAPSVRIRPRAAKSEPPRPEARLDLVLVRAETRELTMVWRATVPATQADLVGPWPQSTPYSVQWR